MKKALLLTDGSLNQALLLSRWIDQNQAEPVDLTVVYAYTLTDTNKQPLKAADYRSAKQEACDSLNRWLNFLPAPWPGNLQTETLVGDPDLVMRLHLLLRRYDYLLIDFCQQGVLSAFMACRQQVTTTLSYLNLPEDYSYSTDFRGGMKTSLLAS